MKKIKNLLVACGMCLATAGAAVRAETVDLTKLPPPADKTGVTYEKDISSMLKDSCVNCHSGEKPKAGLRLDSLEGILKGGKEGKVLVAGQSAKSVLVIAASQLDPENAMPPKRKQRPGGPGGPPPQGGPGPGGPGGPGHSGPPPKPLTPAQVGLLRAWIDQGAK